METINNTRFTHREIDIIACLLSGRATKTIASFLSIAPRTVETHTRNIMRKLDCNSQEGVRDFIEKSEYYNNFKDYYLYLLERERFEQHIPQFKSALGDINYRFLLIYDTFNPNDTPILNLGKYLKQIGIELITALNTAHKTLQHFVESKEYQQINGIFCYISEQTIDQIPSKITKTLEEILNLNRVSILHPSSVILLLNEKKLFANLPTEFHGIDYINVDKESNDLSITYEVLKKLFPAISLERPFAKLESKVDNPKDIYKLSDSSNTNFKESKLLKTLLIGTILLSPVLIYHHSYERDFLLNGLLDNTIRWDQTYSRDIDATISDARFFQFRGNALNLSQAKRVKSNIEVDWQKLEEYANKIQTELLRIQDTFILNPFNWFLKRNLISDLLNQKNELDIVLILNKASKFIAEESFGEAVKALNQLIGHLKDQIENTNSYEQKKGSLKKLIAIAINMKCSAWRKLAEDKEISQEKYGYTLNNIFKELDYSIKNYDAYNFNTYLIMHYIKLLLAEKEEDFHAKNTLEREAEEYLNLSAERAPRESMVLAAQALHYYKTNEYDKAIIAFNDALSIHPDNPAILHNRSEMYLILGEQKGKLEYFHKAYSDAEKANQLRPRDCDLIKLLVWSKIGLKKCDEAQNIFQKQFLPLCVSERKRWDDVSALRNKTSKFLFNKFKKYCRNNIVN